MLRIQTREPVFDGTNSAWNQFEAGVVFNNRDTNPHRSWLLNERVDVLLIDDSDADSRLTLLGVRRGAPASSSLRVKDGQQALRLLFHKGLLTPEPLLPRLILLELNVPIVPGKVVLERLRADAKTQGIPVVVLTSSDNLTATEATHSLGTRGCLIKPADARVYVADVARYVNYWLGHA